MGRPKKVLGQKSSKEQLLQAALNLIRKKGYAATTVDDLCHEAQVSKGTFFHHFISKEDLAIAAAHYWSIMTSEFFKTAPYCQISDPLERLLGYVRFRKELLKGDLPEITCLVGTMTQEVYSSYPAITAACFESIIGHAEVIEQDITQAKSLYAADTYWSAKGLALYIQAVIQGAFILAKASGDTHLAQESVEHLEQYVQLLFKK